MTENNKIYGVILAGGSGSRLWPMSREMYPKQLLKLTGDTTLFQSTVMRLTELIPKENIITVTNELQANDIKLQLQEILQSSSKRSIIGEPVGRNTAPAVGLAALYIKNNFCDDDPIILVTPSDQLIQDNQAFLNAVKEGIELTEKGYIVTFGIKPTRPETGYGYIKTLNAEKLGNDGFKVDEFKEKPDLETAKTYIEQGNYFWNAGIFMFKASTILEEMKKYCPEVLSGLKSIDLTEDSIDKELYQAIPSISIDYAVMEKSKNIALVPVDCGWNDLGSWQAVYDVLEKTTENNVIKGDVITVNTNNCYIHSSSRQISAIGVDNLIIVETKDAVLVCDKNKTQDVKTVFDKLKQTNNPLYLKH
jgi:mannose-1-phosphate guanylyltransferase/mannose-6-phosphate isomerase